MRTTVDIPDDLHAILSSLARDRHTSLSRTVVDLVRQGLGNGKGPARYLGPHPKTGWPVVTLGRTVTTEDVRSLEDEE